MGQPEILVSHSPAHCARWGPRAGSGLLITWLVAIFLWPLPRWRVGHEFRWCVCSVLWLILHFLLDVHFHIEHADAPEEEEQEDGKFRVLLVSLKPGPECCETASSLLVQDLRCHRPYWSEYQFVLSQKVTKWTKRNRPCRVTQLQKSC